MFDFSKFKMFQRLPRNYTPKHYDLFVHMTTADTPFDASVTITFKKNEDSDKAYLNIYSNITIKSVTQNQVSLTYEVDYPLLIINQSTNPDQDISSYPITIDYTLKPILTEYQGFYPNDGCFFTKFEPNHAHRFLPCFDDPIVRSTFSVKIQIPSNLTGLSNMPIKTESTIGEDKLITFQKTPPMCTYLLAVFVGKFSSIEGRTKSGTPVIFYSEEGREGEIQKFLGAAIHAVNWMEEKTLTKYQLPVLQLLSHPGLKTGMENYGLIALRDYTRGGDVLYNTLIVMHEVSHLWFGDLVSVKWWNSVWLNEGFAQYLMYLILRDFSDEYSNEALKIFIESDGIRCLQYVNSERIVVDENEINFEERVLKSVIYIKGAFVLKMFSDIYGEDIFFKVCSFWMDQYQNKSADIHEFIKAANNVLQKNCSNFFYPWLTKVGFPIVKVAEIYENEENKNVVGIKLSQKSFSGDIYQFKISIVYEEKGEVKKMDVLMDKEEQDVMLNFDWLYVNDGFNSLCAPLYSKSLLEKLCEAKKCGKIDDDNSMLIRYSIRYASKQCEVEKDVLDLIKEYF